MLVTPRTDCRICRARAADGGYRVQGRWDYDAEERALSAHGLGQHDGEAVTIDILAAPPAGTLRFEGADGGVQTFHAPCKPRCLIDMTPSALPMFTMTRLYDYDRGGSQAFPWIGFRGPDRVPVPELQRPGPTDDPHAPIRRELRREAFQIAPYPHVVRTASRAEPDSGRVHAVAEQRRQQLLGGLIQRRHPYALRVQQNREWVDTVIGRRSLLSFSAGFGMTDDAPDYSLGVSFSQRFDMPGI